MKVLHRGLTIELDDDDPRVGAIEAVLFARTLPPQIVAFARPEPALPERWREFWKAVPPKRRRELVLLAERRHRGIELEEALGISQGALRGQHQSLNSIAQKHDVPLRVVSSGRGRLRRLYALNPEALDFVKMLVALEEKRAPEGSG